MKLESYLDHIKAGLIPDTPPDGLEPGGWGFSFNLDYFKARDTCIEYGMWAIVDKVWTKALADWIGGLKVLEIMAGAGWLAKALAGYGVDIVATDDYTWDRETHKKMKRVYPVQKAHALEAIASTKADILLVSWPPYNEESAYRAMRLWGKKKPIIYVGEPEGGCNGDGKFFKGFRPIDHPEFGMVSWPGIHDRVMIGKWKGK